MQKKELKRPLTFAAIEKTFTVLEIGKPASVHYEERYIETYILSHLIGEKDAVEELLDSRTGQPELKRWLANLANSVSYQSARKHFLGVSETPDYLNLILSGPPGTGKTTGALLIAAYLAAHGILTYPKLYIATVKDIKGRFIGDSEFIVDMLIRTAREGMLVIDEADTLLVDDRFNEAIIQTLNGAIDKEKPYGTVFMLTGYPKEIDQLMRSNAGLSRRFPHRFHLTHLGREELTHVFQETLRQRHYHADDHVTEKAINEIMKAKDFMGESFGNAGTVISVIDMMEKKHSSRFDAQELSRATHTRLQNSEIKKLLSTFDEYDVPQFHTEDKQFKPSRFGHQLSLPTAMPAVLSATPVTSSVPKGILSNVVPTRESEAG